MTVAGQNINELTAKTDYANKQLAFDATAKQPQRSLNAAGSLLLHPDHQEVHLQTLALQTQGQTWQIAPGAQPSIQYANDTVAVNGLTLVNGDQQIAADGTFGRPGDALKVTLTNVDLASVDALLLRPPQLTGPAERVGHDHRHEGRAAREGRLPRSARAASASSTTTRSAARSTTPARA